MILLDRFKKKIVQHEEMQKKFIVIRNVFFWL